MGGRDWPPAMLANRYELTSQLGQGGMGMVWQAHDHVLNRTVAVKLIKVDASDDANARARFAREAHAAASLSHPNIVTIYDFGIDNDVAFMVMENLPGPNLGTLSKRAGALPIDTCLRLIAESASGLAAAHGAGILHRDIKPANLMLSKTQSVKILDFGIAALSDAGEQLTMDGQIAGTLSYLAPERAMGQAATVQTDLYALGCVAVALLTGRPVFEGTTGGLVMAHMNQAPRLAERFPWLPPGVLDLVERLLEKDPARRPASAAAVAARAESLRQSLASGASGASGGIAQPVTPLMGAVPASQPTPTPTPMPTPAPVPPPQAWRPGPMTPPTVSLPAPAAPPQQYVTQPSGIQTVQFIAPPPKKSSVPLLAGVFAAVVLIAVGVLVAPSLMPKATPAVVPPPGVVTVTSTVPAPAAPGAPGTVTQQTAQGVAYVTVLESMSKPEWTLAEVRDIVNAMPASAHRLVLDSSATPGMNAGYYAVADGPYANQASADAVCGSIGRVVGPHCYSKPVTLGPASVLALPGAGETAASQCELRASGYAACGSAVDFLTRYDAASRTPLGASVGDWFAEPVSYYGGTYTLVQLADKLATTTPSGRTFYPGHVLRYSETATGASQVTMLVPFRRDAASSLDLVRVDFVLNVGSGANPFRIVRVADE